MFEKIEFLLKSKNRHGVHSPFVYQLNDECFNDSKRYKKYTHLEEKYPDIAFFLQKKQLKLFARLLWYLKLKSYAIICNEKKFYSWEESSKYDLILIIDKGIVHLNEVINSMHNHSLLIVQDIYAKNKSLWKKIETCPNIHVTIDTYWQGFAFLRKEQVKEHFTIRI